MVVVLAADQVAGTVGVAATIDKAKKITVERNDDGTYTVTIVF